MCVLSPSEQRCGRFAYAFRRLAVAAVDHPGLHTREVCNAESFHRALPTVQEEVDDDLPTLRSTKEKIGLLETGRCKRISAQLLPQRLGIATPDHVGIHKERSLVRHELMEVVLEANDRSVLQGQGRNILKQIVDAVLLQCHVVRGRAEQCDRAVGIVATQRYNRSGCMAYERFRSVRM